MCRLRINSKDFIFTRKLPRVIFIFKTQVTTCDSKCLPLQQNCKRVTDSSQWVESSTLYNFSDSSPSHFRVISIGKMNLSHFKWARVISNELESFQMSSSHFKWARVISSFENSDSSYVSLQYCSTTCADVTVDLEMRQSIAWPSDPSRICQNLAGRQDKPMPSLWHLRERWTG